VPGTGYPDVASGTSFGMAVSLGHHGPSGRQLLTYSQSTNADQTRLYSAKGWDTIKYTASQLAADPNVRTYVIWQ